jgi:hypothetical protein
MKKLIWIGVAVTGVVAAFFLARETRDGVALEATSAPVSQGMAPQGAEAAPDAEIKPSVAERLPLPNPRLPELVPSLVPESLHPLFGWKEIGGYVPRRRLVEALDRELAADEVQALLMFVRSAPGAVGLSNEDFNGVGDVVLLKLEAQKNLPEEYTDHLVVMFYDETLNATWRDYCIQHLGTVYQRTPEEKRPVIRQLYEDALAPGGSFAGTTLLSMKRSAGPADLPREVVAQKAMSVASSEAFGEAERLSALAVAAEFKHPEAVGLARQVAVSKRSAMFRMASLAVIGQCGDASDRPLLEKYTQSSDIRLRTAATEALKKLTRQ